MPKSVDYLNEREEKKMMIEIVSGMRRGIQNRESIGKTILFISSFFLLFFHLVFNLNK